MIHVLGDLKKNWLPILGGLLVLYIPTYSYLIKNIWVKEEYAHSPIIFIIILYLFWLNRQEIYVNNEELCHKTGVALFVIGIFLYLSGRILEILVFEIGSQLPVLAGILLLVSGKKTVRKLWLPILFLVFLIPIPGFVLDIFTMPLKQYVSVIVDQILFMFGYPIARSGVVLNIGPYQMLIADACSGLNSMFSLSALGLLYIYLKKYKNLVINCCLIISIVPIAFLVNVLRVIGLVLITFYFGDQAGQGYLHNFAGFAELVLAVLLFFLVDTIVVQLYFRWVKQHDKNCA